ncbi:YaiI/YqxD family protein [Alloiococcus otitis]|uniref:YaiI/YqxD family protein n=1 Tax=Alloiococcus otitis TaxID=1652 RepID=UPI0023577041|nr:YaiI/YqxD family protein [Alloiococcus otitis]
MKVIVDGDACPVKDIIIEESQGQEVSVLIVSSFDHYSLSPYPDHVQCLYVEKGRDAVDFKIVQLAQAQDIVVTQDYGLALILVNKVNYVLHHTGFIFTDKLLDGLIQGRYYSQQARKKRQRVKGPAPLKEADRKAFRQTLRSIISIL